MMWGRVFQEGVWGCLKQASASTSFYFKEHHHRKLYRFNKSHNKSKMKVSHLTLSSILLSILPQQSASLKCGIKGITESCIGDTDIRYNPDISYDLKEQDEFWGKFEGLYVQDERTYLADGSPQSKNYLPGIPVEAGLGSWDFCNQKAFVVSKNVSKTAVLDCCLVVENIWFTFPSLLRTLIIVQFYLVLGFKNVTIDGSRYIYNAYFLSKHNADGDPLLGPGLQLPGIAVPYTFFGRFLSRCLNKRRFSLVFIIYHYYPNWPDGY